MAVVHPEPTDATVKALYASALRCAFPGCDKPLYRVDATGSTRTLNSRVAHICARREGGPRWNAEMGRDENRSGENLVILCIDHSYEIDDKDLETKYPAPTLREWKLAQIAEYDLAVKAAGSDEGVGWRLTDEEAAEVIEASERNTNIVIQGHTIQIGGTGGTYGGGGGGGGVVGSGVGGLGGGGGGVLENVNLGDLPSKSSASGGENVSTPGMVDPPRRCTEGVGYIVGRDGAYGGDATIAIGGEVVLRAEGRPGGRAGSGNRVTSDRLAVSTVLIADYINPMPHGLVTLVNGGWSSYAVSDLPAPVTLPVLCVIEAGGVEAGEYTIIVELCAPGGAVPMRFSVGLVVERTGDVLRIIYVFELTANVDKFGLWQVQIRSDTATLAVLDVMIKRVGEAEEPTPNG